MVWPDEQRDFAILGKETSHHLLLDTGERWVSPLCRVSKLVFLCRLIERAHCCRLWSLEDTKRNLSSRSITNLQSKIPLCWFHSCILTLWWITDVPCWFVYRLFCHSVNYLTGNQCFNESGHLWLYYSCLSSLCLTLTASLISDQIQIETFLLIPPGTNEQLVDE